MGYYVRYLPDKKSHPNWKLQFVSYRKIHAATATAKKPKKECDIASDRSRALGFLPVMSLEEARARQRQLNHELRLLHLSERRLEIELREKHSRTVNGALFPELWAGLRPSEIDRLKDPENYLIKRSPGGPIYRVDPRRRKTMQYTSHAWRSFYLCRKDGEHRFTTLTDA